MLVIICDTKFMKKHYCNVFVKILLSIFPFDSYLVKSNPICKVFFHKPQYWMWPCTNNYFVVLLIFWCLKVKHKLCFLFIYIIRFDRHRLLTLLSSSKVWFIIPTSFWDNGTILPVIFLCYIYYLPPLPQDTTMNKLN